MTATFTVTINISPQVLKALDSKTYTAAMIAAMKKSLDKERYELRTNPPKKNPTAFTRLATVGQKKAYWAKVRSGEAQHSNTSGYIRSGRTQRAWESKVTPTSSGVNGELSNKVPHAAYVFGNKLQQPFHRESRFDTEKVIAGRVVKDVESGFSDELKKV